MYKKPNRQHEEELQARLIEEVGPLPARRRAHALWQAARRAVQDPLRSLFEEIEREFPSKVRTVEDWWIFAERLAGPAEAFADSLSWGSGDSAEATVPPRLQRIAEINGWDPHIAAEVWGVEGSAIREALFELDIRLKRPASPEPSPELIEVCRLCWRTATPTPSGIFLCSTHAKFGNDYKNAMARRFWRDSSQPEKPGISFVFFWARELKTKLPPDLRVTFETLHPIGKVCRGEDVPDSAVELRQVPLESCWKLFKRTRLFLTRGKKRVNFEDPRSVLGALDPAIRSQRHLQVRIHELLVLDHQLLFDRLICAEAHLEADHRRRNGDEGAAKGNERYVVQYTYGYAGSDYLIKHS